ARGAAAALADRAMKEAAAAGRCDVVTDIGRTRRLAEDRHILRIAAELGDVVLHPLERQALIEKTLVASWRLFVPERRMRKKPERPESVLDADEHDATLRGKELTVIPERVHRARDRDAGAAGEIATAMDPHHDRCVVGCRL